MTEDPNERREREFDAITFLLAGVLSKFLPAFGQVIDQMT